MAKLVFTSTQMTPVFVELEFSSDILAVWLNGTVGFSNVSNKATHVSAWESKRIVRISFHFISVRINTAVGEGLQNFYSIYSTNVDGEQWILYLRCLGHFNQIQFV